MACHRSIGAWIACGLLICGEASAQIIRYVSRSGSHTSPFTSWATAATNIHAAVAVSGTNNIILVSNGVWAITGTVTLATNNLVMQSVNGPNVTVIEGNNTFRLFNLANGARLEGFTLRYGAALGAGTNAFGGAVFANNARMSNMVFSSCVATQRGGAIYFVTGGGLVTHSRFEQCDSPFGGGVYARNVGIISNCLFIRNRAIGAAGTGGGGVNLYAGGTVTHSEFRGNTAGNDGGGVLIEAAGGQVINCTFIDNLAGDWGGAVAVYFSGGLIRNSLIVSNRADEGGGVYFYQSGTIENCTLYGNTAIQDGDGVKFYAGGTSLNSIIYFNGDENYRLEGAGQSFQNTCTTPALSGPPDQGGNISADPSFLYAAENILHLNTNSPCIGAGSNRAWMSSSTDLYGNPRQIGSSVDMGCYEFGPLVAFFVAAPRIGAPPLPVNFQAYTTGSNLTSLVYRWDYQSDGLFDATNVASPTSLYVYTNGGLYSVRLQVTNAAGQVAETVRTNYIVAYTVHYVATNGGHIAPYSTWANAATNLESALSVAVAGGKIFVSNGTYVVPATISITQAVTISSMNGPTATLFVGTGSSRVFRIQSDVVLNGFGIRNGAATGTAMNAHGGGIFFDAGGLASNCIIAANRASGLGGGVYMDFGGVLLNSTLISNRAARGGGYAAFAAGVAQNLRISTNVASDRGGGAFLFGNTLIRNSVIDLNVATSNGGGVALSSSGPALQNCTVVSNYAANGGGVLCEDGGNIQNSIVYFNVASSSFPNWQTNSVGFNYGAVFSRSCLTPTNGLPNATLCISNNPAFVPLSGFPYGLDALSPCINQGAFNSWMLGASDFLNNPRVIGGAPDIGAVERLILALAIQQPASGTRFPFSQTFVTLSGYATGFVGRLTYTNRFAGGVLSSNIPIATNWSFSVHLPRHGEYQISISATDTLGNAAVDTLTIRRNRNQLFWATPPP